MHGNKILRLQQRVNERQLVPTRVTGHVQLRQALVNDARAVAIHVVDYGVHHALVAGNGVRGQYNGVVVPELDLGKLVGRHARERAHRLALTARREYNQVFILYVLYLFDIYNLASVEPELADTRRAFGNVYHRTPRKRDLAPELRREVYHLL